MSVKPGQAQERSARRIDPLGIGGGGARELYEASTGDLAGDVAACA